MRSRWSSSCTNNAGAGPRQLESKSLTNPTPAACRALRTPAIGASSQHHHSSSISHHLPLCQPATEKSPASRNPSARNSTPASSTESTPPSSSRGSTRKGSSNASSTNSSRESRFPSRTFPTGAKAVLSIGTFKKIGARSAALAPRRSLFFEISDGLVS